MCAFSFKLQAEVTGTQCTEESADGKFPKIGFQRNFGLVKLYLLHCCMGKFWSMHVWTFVDEIEAFLTTAQSVKRRTAEFRRVAQ